MPLADYLPQIDDRRYDDLVTEIRTRIARYTPEWRPGDAVWTDVNDSDPGVTLAQVFAWQAEMLLYRMNRVPALNYIKFLELIGLTLRAAEPARAEVTLPVKATHASPTVGIPERTALSADPGDGGPLVPFETTRAFTAWRAVLGAVLTRGAGEAAYRNMTAANALARDGFLPFAEEARDDAELALGFTDASPLPAGVLDLAITVKRDVRAAQFYACAEPAYPSARLVWESWDGTRWAPLVTLKDETVALTRSGHVFLRMPPAGISAKVKLEPEPAAPQRYWIRVRVTASQYERAPELIAIRTNTVPVEQAETIRDEVLGGSDGSRNQRFTLASAPVLKHSLAFEIEQGDEGYVRWTEVDDLYGSGPRDLHYVLDRTTGTVYTGDGVNGDIPVAYVTNADANVVARLYRTGGGKRGNVPAGEIRTLTTPVDGIDEAKIANLAAAYGGSDEETLEQARARAPRMLKSRDRAVTREDYEHLAMQAGNVRRAKTLPLFHPAFPGVQVPGAVSVIVVPDSDDAAPVPSEGLLRTVCACLDQYRTLTTELYVLKPDYQRVSISAELVVAPDADAVEVGVAVERVLLDYFHPLRGGEDGQGWQFGGTIHYSRVYQRASVPGVASISRLSISVDGVAAEPCTDVAIAPNGLVYSLSHTIAASYDEGSA